VTASLPEEAVHAAARALSRTYDREAWDAGHDLSGYDLEMATAAVAAALLHLPRGSSHAYETGMAAGRAAERRDLAALAARARTGDSLARAPATSLRAHLCGAQAWPVSHQRDIVLARCLVVGKTGGV
jgi:hypothetical protein